MIRILLVIILFFIHIFPQEIPLERNDYQKLTSYDKLTDFVYELEVLSEFLSVCVIGKSFEGRNLYALKFSGTEFGEDTAKIKVLIFAQQHGNEQSGKEGALLLARELLKQQSNYLFDKIDLALIPQINPDGAEVDSRRNARNVDLNRNHLILTEPETQALHQFFDQYLFEATIDVHEYYPYTESWLNFGYIKTFDEQIGCTTNPNVSEKIRDFSNNDYFPFIREYLLRRDFTFQNYIVGGPPDSYLIRHSTYDINDGRQSFGILNSFSFIQEGKNGKDSLHNIKSRTEAQAAALMGFLEFIYSNSSKLKNLIKVERKKLVSDGTNETIAIQMEHINRNSELKLSLLSLYSNSDTTITVNDYRPVVKSVYDVKKPSGYLIPKRMTEIINWLKRQNIFFTTFKMENNNFIEEYYISDLDSINFEGDMVINPVVKCDIVEGDVRESEYYIVPTNQLKSNLVVIALEPKSTLGLHTYKEYDFLIKKQKSFPFLRVIDNKQIPN